MNTKFFKYIIPALSLVFSVNFTSCLGDLDVTPIDPNLNVEFDQNANFAKIYAGLAKVPTDKEISPTRMRERRV